MKPKPPAPAPRSDVEVVRLIWLAIFVSVFSFLFYNRNGDILLYGDAVAHINIARRIFDSKTPGLLQLGTVWLPLPHLLMLPFIVSKQAWQSGAGGSFPSMAAYVLGVFGIFRLVRRALRGVNEEDGGARGAAWAAAILYAANPNLIYMQATAMGESLYLAMFIWTLVYFADFAGGGAKAASSLTKSGLCLAAACLTRYDGWFLAAALVLLSFVIGLRAVKERNVAHGSHQPFTGSVRLAILKFTLLAAAAPVLWLGYNALVYRNPLEFANGPYSAKAIEQKTATVNPAKNNVVAAGSYFLQAAELNIGAATWQGRLWIFLALTGTLASIFQKRATIALLLWLPLPFYALSVAYGSIPIFVPTWWPFSYYNLRYGLQLLPAFAVFVPMGIAFIVQSVVSLPSISESWRRLASMATLLVAVILCVACYASIWRADPVCYREARLNSRGRIALDDQLAGWIKSLPSNSTLLMFLGEHVGALERAGIPLNRVINEGNHRVWLHPADPEGLWERALADPAANVEYAVGFEGDAVWKAAKDRNLTTLVEIHTTGQPRAAIFQGRTAKR